MHKLMDQGIHECFRGDHGFSYCSFVADSDFPRLIRCIGLPHQLAIFQRMVLRLSFTFSCGGGIDNDPDISSNKLCPIDCLSDASVEVKSFFV